MKVAEFILDAFIQEGLTHIFLVPGGLVDPFLPALSANPGITPVVACHEGGAAYMADGYARASGNFGACLCIGGPGVTNTVTAMAAALSDESPLLLITGQVPTNMEGLGEFQDSSMGSIYFNDMEILRAVTALQLAVENIHLLAHDLSRLLAKMLCQPRKPVHMVVPKNIQDLEVTARYERLPRDIYCPRPLDIEASGRFWDAVGDAAHIVILAGAGVEKSKASDALVRFAENFEIPVATTLRAKGVFPEDHPLSLGVFGYDGTRHAIETIINGGVEVLIVLGSGLNQRDTLFWDKHLQPAKALIQVDIDPTVIGRTYRTELAVVGECAEFLQYVGAMVDKSRDVAATNAVRREWLEKIRAAGPRLYDAENATSDVVPIHPARVIHDLRAVMPRDTVLLVDSGAHRAFAGQYWESYRPLEYISATNIGPMGWAIPAAVGAKLARPDAPCAVITGDGCMMMHGMEIQTAARYGLNITYVVINNSAFGNVYLRAKKIGSGPARLTELPRRDWAGFASSLGAAGIGVERPADLVPAFERARAAAGPFLVDVVCGRDYPTPVAPFAVARGESLYHD